MSRPKVVCLCGSTRFKGAFEQAHRGETLRGRIVLSVGVFHHQEPKPLHLSVKRMLDDLHRTKIDMADEILVLNVNGYIGESTKSGIEYATYNGKPVRYLEPDYA